MASLIKEATHLVNWRLPIPPSGPPPSHAAPDAIIGQIPAMTPDRAKQEAERTFKQEPARDGPGAVPDYEARARDVRQKMQYLRSLRLAKQAQQQPRNVEGAPLRED